ncbi:hypothetical protein D210916BOD24_11180 [Alteromonas sp. D210916BOD_24]|uniref:hypothetical protein n=1 Tax=Alteromonas sp. D210916BOD_24 TaxID=3157618 RepID=UPI00399D4597
MTNPSRIFETKKNQLGVFECTSSAELKENQTSAKNAHNETFTTEKKDGSNRSFNNDFISKPYILNASPNLWIEQANRVFYQGLNANKHGKQSTYFLQTQAHFDRMYSHLLAKMSNEHFGE